MGEGKTGKGDDRKDVTLEVMMANVRLGSRLEAIESATQAKLQQISVLLQSLQKSGFKKR
jgi:hypothetical protein